MVQKAQGQHKSAALMYMYVFHVYVYMCIYVFWGNFPQIFHFMKYWDNYIILPLGFKLFIVVNKQLIKVKNVRGELSCVVRGFRVCIY